MVLSTWDICDTCRHHEDSLGTVGLNQEEMNDLQQAFVWQISCLEIPQAQIVLAEKVAQLKEQQLEVWRQQHVNL